MSLLETTTIHIKTRGPVRYVKGKIVQDQAADKKIEGNIQPERNLSKIRETFGSHVEAAIKVYTENDSGIKTQEKGCDADVICYDGRDWEVAEVRKYDDVIPHYKIIAILKKDER